VACGEEGGRLLRPRRAASCEGVRVYEQLSAIFGHVVFFLFEFSSTRFFDLDTAVFSIQIHVFCTWFPMC
jgi:hypothetical protein